MVADLTLRNARIVLADEVVTGSVHVRDGKIEAIDTAPRRSARNARAIT